MHLKNSALSLFFLFFTGWGFFSNAGQITVAIPQQVKLTFADNILNNIAHLNQQMVIEHSQVLTNLATLEAEIERTKAARYVIAPVMASRGNLYILAASVVGSAAFDYLINYLEDQKNKYFASIPPASCQTFQVSCAGYHVEHICGNQCQGVNILTIRHWIDNGAGSCFVDTDVNKVWLIPSDKCIDVAVQNGTSFSCSDGADYYLPGASPWDFVDLSQCQSGQGQPTQKSDLPPLIIPPISADTIHNLVPSGDYTNTITFPDSSNIKTPQDISPPLSSSDGSAIYDVPNYSPDGIFSPDVSDPSNYVPDIPVSDPNIKVGYSITDPITNQTHNYTDMNAQPTPSNNSTDYPYTPTDKDLDTKIDVPDKKDLKTLILSNIEAIKGKFVFDNSCSGGACSFTVSVFGSNATIDFCQFADLFSMIGTVILVFSYFYAFFIVVRGS